MYVCVYIYVYIYISIIKTITYLRLPRPYIQLRPRARSNRLQPASSPVMGLMMLPCSAWVAEGNSLNKDLQRSEFLSVSVI